MDLYPNPTNGMVYISNEGSTEVFNLELTDLNGKVIASQTGTINGTETTEVSLEKLETGIYLIHVFNDNSEKTFRIVKQ
jgi:ABC-type amino acid transport substrate-binding protein